MDRDELHAMADAFFDAISRRDLEAVLEIYHPEAEIWHNVTGRVQSREENLKLLGIFTARAKSIRYEVLAREFFPGGFVQRHTLHATTPSGDEVQVPACLVIHGEGGRIRKLFEYIDAATVAPVFERPSGS